MKVSQIMSRPVVTVTPDTAIKEAAKQLAEHHISALPVVDANDELVGIVSEADLLPLSMRPDPRSQATPQAASAGSEPATVGDIMTRRVVVLPDDSEVSQAARVMIEADVKRVPIVKGRHVIGIVSRSDLIKVIARRDEDLAAEIIERLQEVGLAVSEGVVTVSEGIATIRILESGHPRSLAESIALMVPGVLEVRFTEPEATAGKRAGVKPGPRRAIR
jgi:CBS domain-containing protein